MNTPKPEQLTDGPLVAALKLAGSQKITGLSACCPFHDDSHASMGVYQAEDGIWRVKCHGCGFLGDVFDVRARANGTDVAQELREASEPTRTASAKPTRSWPTLEALEGSLHGVTDKFTYTNPATKAVDLAIFRIDNPDGGKRFLQAHLNGVGWIMSAPPKPWPLYNRARIATAERVVIVEGEKCVHALAKLGIVATTSPCGAGKAKYANWTPLAGKRCILWPDHDDKGREHMAEVAGILEGLNPPATVSMIDPTLLSAEKGDDCVEFIAASKHPADQVGVVLDTAEPLGADREVRTLFEETISGKRSQIPTPWPVLNTAVRALIPGAATILCGDPGSAKSFLMVQLFAALHDEGVRVGLYMLENDRAYHLRRALAQRTENAALTDDDWVAAHPAEVRAAYRDHGSWLASFGRCIFDAPDKMASYDDLGDWIDEQSAKGVRVLGIDPITAAEATDKPWIEDQKFVIRVRKTLRKYGNSVVMVSHPKKGRKGSVGLDDLAGGTAFQRFTDAVLWIVAHHPPEELLVIGHFGRHTRLCNREVRVCKARNAIGGKWKIGYEFSKDALTFREHGCIAEEEKHEA